MKNASHTRKYDDDEARKPRDSKRGHRAKSATLDRKARRTAKRTIQGR